MAKSKASTLLLALATVLSIGLYTTPTFANPSDVLRDRQDIGVVSRNRRKFRHPNMGIFAQAAKTVY